MKKYLLLLITALNLGASQLSADELVLLCTNDTHSQIDPFSEDNLGGVARRKVLIDSVRNARENVLLIDAGDVVQGTLFYNLYKGVVEERLINALGYDMRILGNHEFDNGMEPLARNLAMAEAELLCANYDFRNTSLSGVFKPYSIKDVGGKRIGFVPINLQPKGMISDSNTVGMEYIDMFDTANSLSWYLKHVEHVDMVIALTHIGYDEDVKLIQRSKDIDLLLGAHSHTMVNPEDGGRYPSLVKNAEGREIVVTQAGKGARYLVEVVIDLDNLDVQPEYRLLRVDARLDTRIDPSIEQIIEPYRNAVDALNTTYLTKTDTDLDQKGKPLLNFATDVVEWKGRQIAGNVDMTLINQGGLRNTIEKGKVSEGQLITLMPFFNRVEVIELKGDRLQEAFDHMVKIGGAGVSSNVNAVYDKAAGRWEALTIAGKPIDPDRTYRMATIDYLANGGDYFSCLLDHQDVAVSEGLVFDALLEYFRTGPGKGKSIPYDDTARLQINK